MHHKYVAALALALAALAASASAQTIVTANVTANTTWGGAASPSPIILQNPIFVKSGAILTILPGTIVRGQPRTAAVLAGSTVGTPGTLIVTRTGRIVASGTPAAPIIFTTAAVDNNDDGVADDDDANGFLDAWLPGDVFLDDTPTTAPLAPLDKTGNRGNVSLWGGIVILGEAPTNLGDKNGVGYGKGLVEGLTVPGFLPEDATYGGDLANDNSGSMRFASIRHAGDELGNGNELNGLSLGGVGAGTTLENIEVYCNFDDGVEWFGGTVNGKNLLVSFVGDDMFDLDEGYTGINQFVFGVMPFFNENDFAPGPPATGFFGSASGDKATEFDGDNFRPDNVDYNGNVNVRIEAEGTPPNPPNQNGAPSPLSNPAFYNMTLIGSTPDAGQEFTPVAAAATNIGIQYRNGFAGWVYNTVIVNTGAETGIDVSTSLTAGAPGFNALQNVNAVPPLAGIVCSTLDDGAALNAGETQAVTNGNGLCVALGGIAAACANVTNGSFTGLVKEDQTFDPTGNAAGKIEASLKSSPINPRPTGLAGVGGCPAAQPSPVTFRGAFPSGASPLWTTGWTALNRGGLLAN